MKTREIVKAIRQQKLLTLLDVAGWKIVNPSE